MGRNSLIELLKEVYFIGREDQYWSRSASDIPPVLEDLADKYFKESEDA